MCHPEIPPGAAIPDVRTEEVRIATAEGERIPAFVALPEHRPAPAVVVIGDIFGRSPFYEALSSRLAMAGFVACLPDPFFREGALAEATMDLARARASRLDQRRTMRDLAATIGFARTHPSSTGAVGTIGFCMGGTLALALAAGPERVDATVAYYGFPSSRVRTELSAPEPLAIADRMRGPILGHWGDRDEGVGLENVRELDARLAAAGVSHTFHIYAGLGHGFLKALDAPGAAGHEEACRSWARTLDFYRGALAAATAAVR